MDLNKLAQALIPDENVKPLEFYEAQYPEIIMERLRRSAIPARHFFRYRRTAKDTAVTITATDRFGRTYELVIP